MSVDSQHPQYKHIAQRWNSVRAIVKNEAQDMLRMVDPNNRARSKQYKEDAILTNFTRLTKEGLGGLVFRRPSKRVLADEITYLLKDSTGHRLGLDQLAQKLVGETLETGRHGLLVDVPGENAGKNNKRARIRPYSAESIINWDYIEDGDQYKLSLLVLKEDVSKRDGFVWIDQCQYRVLFLNGDGEYTQVIYNQDLEYVENSIIVPTDWHGKPLNEIPFTFIGSENNDADVDSIPLYDLSVVNLGHYKASADLMESMFVCGQVVPVVNTGETTSEDWHAANPDGILVGSRTPVVVSTGGSFDFKQAGANTLPQQVMADLEKQAAAIGARLIAPPGGRETAEAARIRYGSQNSVLYTLTRNISDGLQRSLDFATLFMSEVPAENKYELNDQFYEENADPNLIAQEIMLLDRGIMSQDEVRTNLKRTGIKLDDNAPLPEVNPLAGVDDELDN